MAAELCATLACAGAAADTAKDDARAIKPEPFIFSIYVSDLVCILVYSNANLQDGLLSVLC